MTPPAMLSVLLVEDDAVVRASMRFALASDTVVIHEAGSVHEAQQVFTATPTDAAIIDLHLPDGTGYALATWLCQRRSDIPLIMISTDPDHTPSPLPPRQRTTMLAKPFSASTVLDALSRVMGAPTGPET